MDIEAILEMYEDDYNPSSKVPGPRNMADGGRIGFKGGTNVETGQGFQPGVSKVNLNRRLDAYKNLKETYGKEIIEDAFKNEFGTSFENIADKKEYKGRTVTNIIDGFKKKIKGINRSSATSPIYNEKTGHIYKTSNRFGTFYSKNPGKNQYSGKLLTENTELIEAIKEDAPTMSDKEIKSKYDIHKTTLKKIKDQNDITTRSSYLPKGEQKTSLPYAERYTAEEKSEMYKKRKARETDEDRAKAKESDRKYRDKIYKEYKMEPSSRTAYDDLWKDISRSSKEGSRIQLVDGPKYSNGATYNDFKTRVFLDTKTGETFNYNNLKQYLDSGKLDGVTYKSVIEPYNLKRKIATSGLREDIQKAYFGEKYKPPKMFRAQNTFHVHHIGGVAADPFSVQLTFADQNLGLVTNKKFNTEWAKLIERNAPLSERKNYLKFVKSKIGDNIAQTLEFPEVGKTRTFGEIGTDMQKLLSNKKFEVLDEKQLTTMLADFGCPKSLQKASGGRIKYSNGTSCLVKGRKAFDEGLTTGKWKSPEQAKIARNIAETAGKIGKTGIGARVVAELFGPVAIASFPILEAGIASYDTITSGTPFKEAINKTLLHPALGDKTKADPEKLQRKDILKMSDGPEKEMLIKYFGNIENLNRVTNNYKQKAGLEQDKELYEAVDIMGYGDDGSAAAQTQKQIEAINKKILEDNTQGKDYMTLSRAVDDPYAKGLLESKQGELFGKRLANAPADPLNPYYFSSNYSGEVDPKRIEEMKAKNIGMGDSQLYSRNQIVDFLKTVPDMEVTDETVDFLQTKLNADYFRNVLNQPGMLGTQYSEGGIASLNVNKK